MLSNRHVALGQNGKIIDFLKQYRIAVPIGFVSIQLGARPEDIMTDLIGLKNKNILEIDYKNGLVKLIR